MRATGLSVLADRCYKAARATAGSLPALMKLVSIPANPVPEDVVTGVIKTRDGVNLRFARWAPPPGRKGTVACCRAAPNSSKNISRPCAICARAALRSRLSTGAGRAVRIARLSDPPQGLCPQLCRIHHRPRSGHGAGGAAGLSAADFRARTFDGRDGGYPRLSRRQPLVRSHRALGADDRAAGRRV